MIDISFSPTCHIYVAIKRFFLHLQNHPIMLSKVMKFCWVLLFFPLCKGSQNVDPSYKTDQSFCIVSKRKTNRLITEEILLFSNSRSLYFDANQERAGPRSAIGRAPDS